MKKLKKKNFANSWSNWAGAQTCHPDLILRPPGLGELTEAVAAAAARGGQITAAASGHSFSGAALTEDMMIDVGNFSGVIEADRTSGLVKVGGGTVLSDLNR